MQELQEIRADLVIAAVLGSASAQVFSSKTVTVRRMITLGCVGAATGIYIGPIIFKQFGIADATTQAGLNFIVGACGLSIFAAIMTFSESSGFTGLLSRFVSQVLGHQISPNVPQTIVIEKMPRPDSDMSATTK